MTNSDFNVRLKRRGMVGFLLLAISMLLTSPLFLRIAVADQGEQSSGMQVSASGNEAQIVSNIKSSGIEREYKAQMDTSQGVRIHVNFQSDSSNTNASKDIEFQASFIRIVEFTDPSGSFTNSSTVVQTKDLTQLNYSPINETRVIYNGMQGYSLSTQASQGSFTFKVVAYSFPNSTNINSTSLSPSDLKVVIYIVNYPYIQNDSLLALQVNTQSDRGIDATDASIEQQVTASDTSAGEQAAFAWNGPLTVDGSLAAVQVSMNANDSQGNESDTNFLSLVYPHGDAIIHDPTIGVYLAPVPFYMQQSFLVEAAAAFAIGAAISVTLVTVKMRN